MRVPGCSTPGPRRCTLARAIVKDERMIGSVPRPRPPARWTALGHPADFEPERDRTDRLMAELFMATAEMIAARESSPAVRARDAVQWTCWSPPTIA
jgi:hypothetical protein